MLIKQPLDLWMMTFILHVFVDLIEFHYSLSVPNGWKVLCSFLLLKL